MTRSRRDLLQGCGVALGLGLAGCLGGGDDPATTDGSAATPTDAASDTPTPSQTPGGDTPVPSEPPTATATRTPTQDGVAWRFDVNAEIHRAPAVADGTVYVGGWEQTGGTPTPGEETSDPTTMLRALSTGDGNERWRVDVDAPIYSRPRVVGDVVYVTRGYTGISGFDFQVRAVSTDGEPLWRYEAQRSKALTILGADESGIAVGEYDDYAGGGAEQTAALTPDGSVAFERQTGDVGRGTVDADTVYVLDRSERVLALDRETGDERWRVERESYVRWATLHDGTLLVLGPGMFAVDAADGTVRWSTDEWSANGLFVDGGRAFAPTDDGRLVALDPHDGAELWSLDLGDERVPSMLGGDALYVSRPDGTVSAHDTADGEQLWATTLDGQGYVRVADDRVYVLREAGVRALSADEGDRIVTVETDGRPQWLVPGADRSVVATPDGIVYGLDV